jgi:hypothetical protein
MRRSLAFSLTSAVVCSATSYFAYAVELSPDHARISPSCSPGCADGDIALIRSKQAEEVHSVIVDMPLVPSLAHASPENWADLPSVQLDEQIPDGSPELNETAIPFTFAAI